MKLQTTRRRPRKLRLPGIFLMALMIVASAVFFLLPTYIMAGPPFKTDDPEPVEFRHWEIYLAMQYNRDRDETSMTLPHIEANYGLAPDLHLHLLVPALFVKPEGQGSQYGLGDIEFGVKYRLFHEKQYLPQIGIFPLIVIPTGDESRGLGNGRAQVFLPIWLQKILGSWTTYGGGGYWINPGEGNKNWWFFGWEVQRGITGWLTLGAELYYKTPSTEDADASKGYTVGAILNFTQNHHLLISAGQDLQGPNDFNGYIAYQLTFGPK